MRLLPFPLAIPSSLLRLDLACGALGDSRRRYSEKVIEGVVPRPVKIGARAVAVPAAEVEAVAAARIRGASTDEIKKLVADLHAGRARAGTGR